jgi:phenylacetate-CoA ligase
MKGIILISYVRFFNLYRNISLKSFFLMKLIYIPGINKWRKFNGVARAYYNFSKAKRTVPAYKEFLKSKNFIKPSFNGFIPNMHEIPEIDKENYVKLYDIDSRCVNGKIPDQEVIIDESSGSSGTATNWVRGFTERNNNARIINFGIQTLFGKEPLFIINGFALGPWATGVNITMSCVKFSKLKSLGPDKIKIENTLKQFGTKHKYIVMGYPPFLKMLVDQSDINWHEYNISFIFGGESMSEGMRDYLQEKGIKKIYSSLGASDLELNISSENDFTISLRRLIRSNDELKKRILKFPGALPMVFQFHPSDFLIESSPEGELIITICRPGYISPKIRYNIHDRGHVMDLKELYQILDELNIDRNLLVTPQTDLPLLFHYGRADMTISFFGSNISPVDVNEVIFLLPELANSVNSFCISINEDREGNKVLIIHLELMKDVSENVADHSKIELAFFETLASVNQDFREAFRMINNPKQTSIQFHPNGEGPFVNNDIRIKAKYLN